MATEDEILNQIYNERYVSFTKDDSEDRFKALDKLRAFGLVEPHGKYSWQLTKDGYNAVSKGFDKFISGEVLPDSNLHVENLSIIQFNKKGLNQSNIENFTSKHITSEPQSVRSNTDIFCAIISKYWWYLIIPIIVIILGLIVEYHFFR